MDVIVLIGRILFAILFIGSGMGHLSQTEGMTGYAESKGVPQARAMVILSGIIIILAALSIAFGVWADLAALVLVVFLVLTATLMHGPWKAADDQEKQTAQVQFMKDLGLAGASLILFAFFAATPDLGLTVTGPLFEGLFT
ncbi:MAG: DoxX family protein [Actinomycetota bacterium]